MNIPNNDRSSDISNTNEHFIDRYLDLIEANTILNG